MSQSGGSSFPVGKVLLGCGCVGVLIGGIVIAVLVFGGIFVANEVKNSEVGELLKEIDDQVDSTGGKKGGTKAQRLERAAKKKASDKLNAVEPEEMLGWPAAPLTKKDVNDHVSFMKKWEGSASVKEMRKNRETLDELSKKTDKDRGAIDNLRALNAVKNVTMNSVEANEEMERIAAEHGGTKLVMKRYFQLVAVAGAASGASKDAEIATLTSDATAQQMLAMHDEWQKKYTTWTRVNEEYYRVILSSQSDPEMLERLSKDPDFQKSSASQKELNEVQGSNPGLLVLGKLPRVSVETWAALDVSVRKDIIERYAQLPFIPFFAFIAPEKYNAKAMATQILALEYARLTSSVARAVEAENKAKTP